MSRIESFILRLDQDQTQDAAAIALSMLPGDAIIDLVLSRLDGDDKAELFERLREELGEDERGLDQTVGLGLLLAHLLAVLEEARPYVEHAADDPAEPDNPAAQVLARLVTVLAKAGAL